MSQIDAYESSRLSLLDVAMDKLRVGNKKGVVNRLFLSGKLAAGLDKKDKKSFGQSVEKFLKNCQSQLSQETASGIMILYNQHVFVCLESSQEIIMMFLKELTLNSEVIKECKVLSFMENVPTRLFQHGFADVCLPNRPLEQKHETSDTTSQVSEINVVAFNHFNLEVDDHFMYNSGYS